MSTLNGPLVALKVGHMNYNLNSSIPLDDPYNGPLEDPVQALDM